MGTSNYDRGYGREQERSGFMSVPSDLHRLEDMDDYEVEEGDVDPRGFDLYGRGGDQIGTIDSLLASESTMKAHFAIVNSGGMFAGKKYIIPVDQLELRDGKAYTQYSGDLFENAPEWNDDERDYDRHLTYWRGVTGTAAATGSAATGKDTLARGEMNREMRVPVVEETAEVHREVEQTGAVTLRKRAETTTEHISAPVSRTRVNVETRDVSPEEGRTLTDADTTTLREGESLRVPIVEEHVEIAKEPRVTKEVVVSADTVTDRVEEDVTLRREVVDIDREGELEEEEADSIVDRPGTRRY